MRLILFCKTLLSWFILLFITSLVIHFLFDDVFKRSVAEQAGLSFSVALLVSIVPVIAKRFSKKTSE